MPIPVRLESVAGLPQPTMHAVDPLEALQMALRQLPSSPPLGGIPLSLTHHSDRGLQYCCHAYTGLLKKNDIAISMTHDTYAPRRMKIAWLKGPTVSLRMNWYRETMLPSHMPLSMYHRL